MTVTENRMDCINRYLRHSRKTITKNMREKKKEKLQEEMESSELKVELYSGMDGASAYRACLEVF